MQRSFSRRSRLLAGTAVSIVLAVAAGGPAAMAQSTVNAGEVSATGTATSPQGATQQPSEKKVFKSNQTVRVMDRAQMDAAGPVGGAAQVLSYAPGANVTGYGNTGSTKNTVSINGVHQGWGGFAGYTDNGSLAVTFDGVPIADPATNLWQSNTIPQMSLIQNTNVTYGPGAASDRWFNNIGGGLEFTPLQPTTKPGGEVEMTYGSYNQKNMDFRLNTGTYHGWSTVLAGGLGNGDSYRTAPDGFTSPSENYAIYLKTIKTFQSGSLEFGGYYAHSGGYRPPVIPTTPVAGITMTGPAGTQLYSQQTSGFYSTLPFSTYDKKDYNTMALVYGRGTFRLDDTTTLHNLTWFMHIDRLHSRLTDAFNLGPTEYEYNNPYTNSFGDKLWLTEKLPYNTVDVGAYYIHTLYNSRNNFYNPANGGSKTTVNIGGTFRSSYFNQDDTALFLQDDIHPIPMLHITPGIRLVNYQVGYSNSTAQDFAYAPGVVLYHNGYCAFGTPGVNTNDQSSNCGGHQSSNAIEPSIDVSVNPLPWLNVYGGYQISTAAPAMGGGGGLFQKYDPSAYHAAMAQYYQMGFKVHVPHLSVLNDFIFGASYFHLRYAKQFINIALASGNALSASGTSVYDGVNFFFDDNPIFQLHVFGNGSIQEAHYTSYVTGGVSYNGSNVPYVPAATFNAGAYYDLLTHGVLIEPRAWYQFVGSQYIFNDITSAPSNQTMPAYGTLNLAVKATVPLHLPGGLGTRYMDLKLTALNVLNSQHNIYEVISAGGYFGTATQGYTMAYPGAPFTIYGTVGFRF